MKTFCFLFVVCVFLKGIAAEDDASWHGITAVFCGSDEVFFKAYECLKQLPDPLQEVKMSCVNQLAPDTTDVTILKGKLCDLVRTGTSKMEECFMSKKDTVIGTLTPEDMVKAKASMACIKALLK